MFPQHTTAASNYKLGILNSMGAKRSEFQSPIARGHCCLSSRPARGKACSSSGFGPLGLKLCHDLIKTDMPVAHKGCLDHLLKVRVNRRDTEDGKPNFRKGWELKEVKVQGR